MKNFKSIIIALICLIIILLIVTILILNNKDSKDKLFLNQNIEEEAYIEEPEETVQSSDYFIIKSCVQGYIDALDKTNSIYYTIQENGEQTYDSDLQKQTLYSFLSTSYINSNNITEKNVDNYIKVTNEKYRFYPIEIKQLNNNEVQTFKVIGIIQNLEYKNATKVYFIVNIDYSNNAFSIQQLEEKEYKEYNKVNDTENSIKNNGNNVFSNSNIDVQKVSVEYLNLYKFLTLADPQITYNMMTEEYRNKRFGSLDNYEQYIKDNYEEFKGIYANKYLTNNTDKAVQYVVQDQYKNNYIFDAVDALKYNVSLDTYTIDGEKFNSTYSGASEDQKVQMNIGKFFDMINRHDYRTSYSCLADSFKNNSVKSEKDFENTIKNNLFTFNNYKVNELKSIGSKTYECQLSVKDDTESNIDTINMTIIMQLQEDKNFVMSFSFN